LLVRLICVPFLAAAASPLGLSLRSIKYEQLPSTFGEIGIGFPLIRDTPAASCKCCSTQGQSIWQQQQQQCESKAKKAHLCFVLMGQ